AGLAVLRPAVAQQCSRVADRARLDRRAVVGARAARTVGVNVALAPDVVRVRRSRAALGQEIAEEVRGRVEQEADVAGTGVAPDRARRRRRHGVDGVGDAVAEGGGAGKGEWEWRPEKASIARAVEIAARFGGCRAGQLQRLVRA